MVSVSASRIDQLGIDGANAVCLEQALRGVGERAELRLVDGRLTLGAGAPVHKRIEHGDATSAAIAAASIEAEVAHDRLMARLGARYPRLFERYAGYGTKEHMAAVAEQVSLPLSYAPSGARFPAHNLGA